MPKTLIDRHYNIVQKDSSSYVDEINTKMDLVVEAVNRGSISQEEGAQLLRVVLSRELTKDARSLAAANLGVRRKRNGVVLLFNQSSVVERYAS